MLDKAIEAIRQVLGRQQVQPKRFILFGSRARGDAHPDSDWDIFVVVDRDLNVAEQRHLITQIKRSLALLRIPNDVILSSEQRFLELKDYPGSLSYEVATEGVVV